MCDDDIDLLYVILLFESHSYLHISFSLPVQMLIPLRIPILQLYPALFFNADR